MNIEEKAKRYVLEQLEENGYRNFHGGEWVEDAFTAGYTQAVTDLNAENEKLREALRDLVEDIEDSKIYWRLANTPMYKALITPEIFEKAKHLITEEK